MTNKNPWRGLASYDEPKNDGNDYLFCGRDEETLDVVRLIDNNLFITLYGSSGIGKSSLLKAGVIPILRRKDYFPLYVRLSQEPDQLTYAEAIVNKLRNSGLTEECHVAPTHPDGNDRLYLWNYFATTRFFSEGREVYPVVILDQFEEQFRDTDKTKADLLLKQIYLLLNDELEMPDEEGYSDDTNYRFVASIREDFLFVLEDSIDEHSLDLYKNNRYRLRPLKPEQAKEVVLVPGKDCIEDDNKEAVAKQIVGLAEHNGKNSIDTLLLSLVCSELYNVANQRQSIVTKALIDQLGDNILSSFYERAMKSISPTTVNYLESHLLTQSGFRNSIALEDILHDGIKKDDLDKLIKNRIIKIETSDEIDRVEFIHDAVCSVAKSHRNKHNEKENRKSRISHGIGYFFDIFIPYFCILLAISIIDVRDVTNTSSIVIAVLYFVIVCGNSIFLIPYRHTQERNSIWILLIVEIMYIVIGLVALLLDEYDKDSMMVLLAMLGGEWWIILQFIRSFGFNKKNKGIRDALKYSLKLQIYKEFPYFKIILLITSLAFIGMMRLVFA